MTIILLIVFFALLILGMPIYFTMIGASAAVLMIQNTMDPVVMIQRMVSGLDKFSIMAVPFFMFCADIMSAGEIGKRLVNAAKAFFGHLTGGLAITTAVACLVFGAVSGAGAAAVVAIGGLMYGLMKDGKYDDRFSQGLILTTSTLAMLIPPSIAYVLYGNITGDSINKLFMSGLEAGLIFGGILIVYSYVYAKVKKIPVLPKMGWKERMIALKDAIIPIGLVAVILGGIYGGICTATEAAAVACIYAIIAEVVIYKSLNLKDLCKLAVKSGQTISMLMILIAAGSVLSWIMTIMQLPQMLATILGGTSKIVVLLLINVIFLIAGMFVDVNSAILVLTPIVYPTAVSVGISTIQLGTMIVINMAIGMISPPFGMNLFVGTNVFKRSFSDIAAGIIRFLAISLVVLLLFTFIPALSTTFPEWFG